MQDLQEYIREFMDRQGLSITALSEKLGYKSKTSLERILSGTSRKKSLDRFEEAMTETFSLSRPELDALRQAKQVSLSGREEFRMNQEMWAFVQGQSDRSGTELHITQGEAAVSLDARYEKLDQMQITVVNCQYVPGLLALLGRFLARPGVQARHYLSDNGDSVRLVAAVSMLRGLFYRKNYQAYTAALPERERNGRHSGVNDADIALFQYTDGQGQPVEDVVVFHSSDSGRLLQLPGGAPSFAPLLGLDGQVFTPLKRTYFERSAFEDYVGYSRDYAALEYNRTVYKIKPDFCVDQIPVSIMLASLLRGTSDNPDITPEPGFFEVLKELEDIYGRRVENTFSKRKHAYTIFKRNALRRFALTGRTTDHFWMMAPYTVRERIDIFKQLLDQQLHNPYIHMMLLKNNDALRDMEIAYYEGEGLLFLEADTDYKLDEDHTEVLITHPDMLAHFRKFYLDVLMQDYVYPESETCRFFREIIAELTKQLPAK